MYIHLFRLLRTALTLTILSLSFLKAGAKLPRLSAEPLAGYDIESVKRAMDSRPLHHIEGKWRQSASILLCGAETSWLS